MRRTVSIKEEEDDDDDDDDDMAFLLLSVDDPFPFFFCLAF